MGTRPYYILFSCKILKISQFPELCLPRTPTLEKVYQSSPVEVQKERHCDVQSKDFKVAK